MPKNRSVTIQSGQLDKLTNWTDSEQFYNSNSLVAKYHVKCEKNRKNSKREICRVSEVASDIHFDSTVVQICQLFQNVYNEDLFGDRDQVSH